MELGVEEIAALLVSPAAAQPVEAGAGYSHLDHARQTAAILASDPRNDEELVVAGLVHDIGQLFAGVGDLGHAQAGEAGVRRVLGERVATLVGLHVEAKRYLSATVAYGEVLSPASVASLMVQGGPMTPAQCVAFEALDECGDAVSLRKADDRAKVDDLVVADLSHWLAMVRRVAVRAER